MSKVTVMNHPLISHKLSLIRDEAIMLIEFDDSLEVMSDEEYDALVDKKTKEIKDELMNYGIYENKFGTPLFLYC